MTERPAKEKSRQLWPILVVVLCVFIFILGQILAVNLVAIYGLSQKWGDGQINDWLQNNLTAQFSLRLAGAIVGIGLVLVALRWLKIRWSDIGLKKPEFRDVLYALGGFACYLPIYFMTLILVSSLLPSIDLDQAQQLGFEGTQNATELLLIFISLVILPPIYEEILTRGFLYTGLRQKLTFPVAAVITSLLFGAAHLEWGSNAPLLWAAAIDTFILSLVLVYLREKTGSLWPAIGLHAIKNFIAFLLLFVFAVQ